MTLVDNDDIGESDFYYYAEEDIPMIEENISVPEIEDEVILE